MPTDVKTTWTGQPLRRREEDRLVRGKGKFIDDYKLEGMPCAHARGVRIQHSAAGTETKWEGGQDLM